MRRTFIVATVLLLSAPLAGHTATRQPPAANASAVDIVKFAVDAEGHAADAEALLRGASRSSTQLETDLFTHELLASWYALKAKEAASPDPGNVTNGDTDYLISDAPDGSRPPAIKFKDMSDKVNTAMVMSEYRSNGPYSTLFFLRKEDDRLKIDDILFAPAERGNFNPYMAHRPGIDPGLRQDITKALDGSQGAKK